METLIEAVDVEVGFHPEGYRIDKTGAPIYRYTKWRVESGNHWVDPKPICFHSLPEKGWIVTDRFDWEQFNGAMEQPNDNSSS